MHLGFCFLAHMVSSRFKPIAVDRRMIRSRELMDPTLAWLETLQLQIDRDIPNRVVVRR